MKRWAPGLRMFTISHLHHILRPTASLKSVEALHDTPQGVRRISPHPQDSQETEGVRTERRVTCPTKPSNWASQTAGVQRQRASGTCTTTLRVGGPSSCAARYSAVLQHMHRMEQWERTATISPISMEPEAPQYRPASA